MDFLPASATSAKAKKHALKLAAQPTHKQSSSKNSNKSKSSKSKSTPMFLSTQPAASAEDDAMTDAFERLPMDSRSDAQKAAAATAGQKVAAGDADAAMAVDDDDEDDDAVMINPSDLSVPEPVVRTKLADIAGADALSFPAVSHVSTSGLTQRRKVGIPQHRMTPLKRDWIKVSFLEVTGLHQVAAETVLTAMGSVWRRFTARWLRSAACRFG